MASVALPVSCGVCGHSWGMLSPFIRFLFVLLIRIGLILILVLFGPMTARSWLTTASWSVMREMLRWVFSSSQLLFIILLSIVVNSLVYLAISSVNSMTPPPSNIVRSFMF